MVSAGGFGLVYGLSARAAGFSPIEASAMSLFVFAGASQFVAVGYVLGGFSWAAVVVLTAFINARHFLYPHRERTRTRGADRVRAGPRRSGAAVLPRPRHAADRRAGGPEMSVVLVPLAILMGLAAYPFRAIPLLAPGMHRLPARVQLYLRLVGPAVLAALAAVDTMVVLDAARRPSFHMGPEWLAVGLCILVVALRRSLLVGLVLAAGFMAVLRATGHAAIP